MKRAMEPTDAGVEGMLSSNKGQPWEWRVDSRRAFEKMNARGGPDD